MTWLIPDVQSLGRVAVLMGGRSAEREISIMSGTGVLAALKAKGIRIVGTAIHLTLRINHCLN